MQFSYKVSEEEYRRACKLRFRGNFGSRTFKVLFFWVFVLVCLVVLWAIVTRSAGTGRSDRAQNSSDSAQVLDQDSSAPQTSANPPSIVQSVVFNVGPFILIGAVWFFMLFRFVPGRLGKLYHKDPAMQGTYTLEVTSASLTIQNTAGLTTNAGWNIYEYWLEGKDFIILVMRSTAYFIISLAGLSEPQRDELRSILASVLPKK